MNNSLFAQYLHELHILDPVRTEWLNTVSPDTPLLKTVEEMGIATEDQIFTKLSAHLGVPYINLMNVTISLFAVRLVQRNFLQKHEIIPIFCDHDTLEIATACPGDWQVNEMLRFMTDRQIVENLAPRAQILEALADLLDDHTTEMEMSSDEAVLKKETELRERQNPQNYLEFDDLDAKNASVKILNRLIKNAIYRNVSDMHVEPHMGRVVVRMRIDGELSDVSEFSPTVGASVISRLKVLADMDITKSHEPQDGNFSVRTKNIVYDLRVSSVATPYGEKIVVRFLNPNQGKVQLVDLGLLPDVEVKIHDLSRRPQGLIIITGPTGSGKNTTLCSIINSIKSRVSNIVSVEDPVEYDIEGVNQIAVNARRGVTFASALRAILRQDPNVIYIGEIRDEETAEIACLAAQTGHLVFSTLHTNDAPSAVTRLLNMGVKPHVLADALTAVIAQRLSRRICSDCSQFITADPPVRAEFAACAIPPPETVKHGYGCIQCGHTGFRGRVAVTELLEVDGEIRTMISEQCSATKIMEYARSHGFRPMWETGLQLVAMGKTTVHELARHVDRTVRLIDDKADFPRKILVVDDEPAILSLCKQFLNGTGAEVITASDGDYGLLAIKKENPDFILTDLNMPRVDGFALCSKVRQDPATATLPIIAMTGKGSTDEAECTTLELGVNDFIRKPLRRDSLIARIRAAYRRQKAAG